MFMRREHPRWTIRTTALNQPGQRAFIIESLSNSRIRYWYDEVVDREVHSERCCVGAVTFNVRWEPPAPQSGTLVPPVEIFVHEAGIPERVLFRLEGNEPAPIGLGDWEKFVMLAEHTNLNVHAARRQLAALDAETSVTQRVREVGEDEVRWQSECGVHEIAITEYLDARALAAAVRAALLLCAT